MSMLTHLDQEGRALIVDVGSKGVTSQLAWAQGELVCASGTPELVKVDKTSMGSVTGTAELASEIAAKRTANLIPPCHPLALSKAEVTAATVAWLTLFDTLNAVDKGIEIGAIRVTTKQGGKSDSRKQA
ncbi:cyclic pyranopterin monophosphate synthase MoaC [Erythrobacter mangrovi]|uniref:Cyclic pyranopterin monophosphate synthase MoaC n=1 Tax=Erythrobacter mangrovi TaxID=2739433 RepID=A0A7D4CE22_9SPHN|nr:cyclic pyranopterin monophosphate synthase MoaC [Erythrobacter mangrovi]QKG72169.1 cyclic pyranopterin monophosphate synthase MoaC [Erythrobacter mangrovi]